VDRRDRAEPREGVRCRRGRPGADPVRRGRLAVRQAHGGPNLEVNYLLQRLDSFEGVAILTTNFGTAIDAAFKRRLSARLTFPFPDDEARERLWRVHLPAQVPRAGTLDLAGLARRYKLSGGYIRNAALRAAFLAAEEKSPLTQDHLERAVRAEFREGGKLAESGQLE
jgi:SpoVK/Ycf46/Vps4 family AAA+-type ATPase